MLSKNQRFRNKLYNIKENCQWERNEENYGNKRITIIRSDYQ